MAADAGDDSIADVNAEAGRCSDRRAYRTMNLHLTAQADWKDPAASAPAPFEIRQTAQLMSNKPAATPAL